MSLKYNAPQIELKADFNFKDSDSDGYFVIVPLSPTKKRFFMDLKKFAIPLKGSYEY